MPSALRKSFGLGLLFYLLLSVPAGAAEPLAYRADLFTFIGQDEKGYVLFSFRDERGVDRGKFQAEQNGALYDQYQGWINLVGTGDYRFDGPDLAPLPDSPTFQFSGESANGLLIRSRANDLSLEINPIAARMQEKQADNRKSWGTAAAILSWQGRSIPGRVIHTGLTQHNGNRLTQGSDEPWDGFDGFSLAVKSGAAANWQDIYLRSERLKKNLRTYGFIDAGRRHATILAPDLKVQDRGWALGLFRWNKAWQMSLQQVEPDGRSFPPFARLELRQVSRTSLGNWVIGGAALSVVAGKIEVNGQRIAVLGLAEMHK